LLRINGRLGRPVSNGMKLHRHLRVANLIKEKIAELIERELEFQNTVVTVTAVEVSKDLLQAKVKLGIIPNEKAPEVFLVIGRERRYFQHKLLKKINIKPMPAIKFEIMKE
jgi:ribosome-binding factor A